MALNGQLRVPATCRRGGPGLSILGFQQRLRRHARSPPRSGPRVHSGAADLAPLATAGPKVARQLCRHEPGGPPRPPAR